MRFAPPPPGSILTLSVIGFGALASHALLALALALIDWYASTGAPSIAVPFQPNMYASMVAIGGHTPVAGADIAGILVETTVLSLLVYRLAPLLLDKSATVRQLRYGWLTDLIEQATPDNRYTTAFVLSSVQNDGVLLGYEGLVENLAFNSDKEIVAVTLLDVSRFAVHVGSKGVRRSDVRRELIPRLYIDKNNFKNVALTVYELDTEPGPAETDASG
jgi:hypothetical protein